MYHQYLSIIICINLAHFIKDKHVIMLVIYLYCMTRSLLMFTCTLHNMKCVFHWHLFKRAILDFFYISFKLRLLQRWSYFFLTIVQTQSNHKYINQYTNVSNLNCFIGTIFERNWQCGTWTVSCICLFIYLTICFRVHAPGGRKGRIPDGLPWANPSQHPTESCREDADLGWAGV